MYFQSHLGKTFRYLDEGIIESIIDKVKSYGEAILYYNKAADVINVAYSDLRVENLSEIIPIALFVKEDFEFAETNREIINTMSNEELGVFMVDRVLNNKRSICGYLKERSELSTYKFAKILNIKLENNRIRIYTSNVNINSVGIGDKVLITPIEGRRYQAVITELVNATDEPYKEGLILEFEEDNDIPISVISKLIGKGIKLAPKVLNADTDANVEACTISSPESEGTNTVNRSTCDEI